MSGPKDQYGREMFHRFGYVAVWTPGTPAALGDVGLLDGGVFSRLSSLKAMQIPFARRGDHATEDLQHTSSSGVEISFKAEGDPVPPGSSLVQAKAGVSIGFQRRAGVVLVAQGCTTDSIEDQLALRDQLAERLRQGRWDTHHVVVTEVLRASSLTVLLSESSGGRLELTAEGGSQLGLVTLANVQAGLAVSTSRGMNTQIIARDALTPLVRVRRLRKRLLGGTVFGMRGGSGQGGGDEYEFPEATPEFSGSDDTATTDDEL